MAIRVAINGFGRIGRLVLRAAYEAGRRDLEFVAINDLGSVEANAHLLKWDSVHGRIPGEVKTRADGFDLGNFGFVKVLAERDPAKLPWRELNIDVVMECTGLFTKRDAAAKHLEAGAKRVLISAPAPDADLTIVYGVNHKALKPEHHIVSNGSCTTNCLAPVAQVLHQTVGIARGYMPRHRASKCWRASPSLRSRSSWIRPAGAGSVLWRRVSPRTGRDGLSSLPMPAPTEPR